MAAECTRYRPHPLRCNGWLPLFQYLQGLDEEQESSVRFKQRSSIGQEEEGQGRSRGRGRGLRVSKVSVSLLMVVLMHCLPD